LPYFYYDSKDYKIDKNSLPYYRLKEKREESYYEEEYYYGVR